MPLTPCVERPYGKSSRFVVYPHLISSLYSGTESAVKYAGGVAVQECTMAPVRFKTCMNWIMGGVMESTGCGVSFRSIKITDLEFTDDAALLAELVDSLVGALDALSVDAEPFGLHMLWVKTVRSVSAKSGNMDVTDSFVYLGSMISSSASCEVARCLGLAQGVMRSLDKGVGNGILLATSLPILSRYFDKRFALATSVAFVGNGLGMFIFSPLTQIFVTKYGLRGAFLILSAINANTIVCAIVMRPITVISQDLEKQNTESDNNYLKEFCQRLGFRLLCSNHAFALMMLAVFLGDTSYLISVTMIVPQAVDIGIPAMKASFLVTSLGIASLSTRVVLGWFVEKVYIRPAYILPIAMLTMGAAQVTIASITVFPVLIASCILIGVSDGVYFPLLFTSMKELVGATNYSLGNGITLLSVGIAGIVSSQAGGLIYDTTGSFKIVFYLAAILNLISALLFCVIAVRVCRSHAYDEKTMKSDG
ncbi:monocarboxylate transporter 12-like [Saccoglossus kowalevskii]|uniref:Monocarboxylate transporter 12-like n=1 Tax=Saccoglossus kowalevskii TaxID=10224 RepID=A0ABM0MKY8_SACKO|nr:PREDICTED: monocarboxylate transporter 12-like [Saccoglossus kowalevskii]